MTHSCNCVTYVSLHKFLHTALREDEKPVQSQQQSLSPKGEITEQRG